jgi:hypothetical protein
MTNTTTTPQVPPSPAMAISRAALFLDSSAPPSAAPKPAVRSAQIVTGPVGMIDLRDSAVSSAKRSPKTG